MSSFTDSSVVAGYVERTARVVPGVHALHRMAGLLLAERAPSDARVLVLGAGGGMELKALAEMQPRWYFDGVDPSAEMLGLARTLLGPLGERVCFHEGFIDTAPSGPYDAAICLLTLHFLEADQRRRTLQEVFHRMKPGTPCVVAHHSFPNDEAGKDKWLSRYAAYGAASGVSMTAPEKGIAAMRKRLPVLSPEQDVALLREAGFTDIELFYAAFTFKGWVARKPGQPA
jgi:tRNA (cmo5U34)-methyltransferase